jgi:hypothetical protein
VTPTGPAGPAATATSTTPSNPPPAGTSTSPSSGGGGGGGAGGGGGTEPARTELTFVAMGTRFTPQRAGVAPFIAVKVTLVSRDAGMHALTIGGTTLVVDRTHPRATATLPGLRAGRSYVGHTSRGQTVRIDSTSEPGP